MSTSAPRLRPYRRRNARPLLATLAVLAVLAAGTWGYVMLDALSGAGTVSCNTPAAGSAGTVLDSDALAGVAPVAPTAVRATVLNAGGQRGHANLVAAQLGDLGFGQAGRPDNDAFYPEGDLDCYGQLRFGQAGESGASTLALVLPCLELIRDQRADDSVDVAIGSGFTDVKPTKEVRDALEALAAPGSAETADGQQVALDPQELAAQAKRC